jgi:hypothetical protein
MRCMRIQPGTVFGHLTVKHHVGSNKHGQAMWACVCVCGKMKAFAAYKLRRGETRSCGCQRGALRLSTLTNNEFKSEKMNG